MITSDIVQLDGSLICFGNDWLLHRLVLQSVLVSSSVRELLGEDFLGGMDVLVIEAIFASECFHVGITQDGSCCAFSCR